MEQLIQQVEEEFQNRFGDNYKLIKSPGRVNLIGEHTDYNDGFVLPAAVDKGIYLAMNVNGTNSCRFYAIDKEESFETEIIGEFQKSDQGWPNYLLGVVDQLQKHGYEVGGFDCVFGGNVPIGAGMSSSAALEGGVLFGLAELNNWDIPPVEMAQIAQKAENDFVGVQCGIMDQFASLNGKEGNALKLDCRNLDYEYFPFNRDDIQIVLCDTQVRRELASSEYNVRREQCEQGVEILQQWDSEIESLRDLELSLLLRHEDDMDPTIFKRCKYVVEENKRVIQACSDLHQGAMDSFGQRMYQSHAGLRYEYEVSCEELDVLVDIARNLKGVFGARMMGGGFGGCTINIVQEDHVDSFTNQIKDKYQQQMNKEIKIYQTKVSSGTHLISSQKITSS
ncbi:galactokinase [Aliifodinibius salipaludis]|uniref:Galactokinase n=1 Tax=Fodinibius salipaludis TaxID=2032627 RepID=A0A2A2GD76_9BACT|nr:galactokinase [Aliifodinibius salipaludis]PAU95586.1 galactokinase [Aliifodinibius salipaludis]